MRKIDEIIVHCSASKWGTVADIDKWHKERGWKGCGYHFVILNGQIKPKTYMDSLDGSIAIGRPVEKMGSHCQGHNKNTIGICLIGKDEFSDFQLSSLITLVDELKTMYSITKISPHNKYNENKNCPNFDISLYV